MNILFFMLFLSIFSLGYGSVNYYFYRNILKFIDLDRDEKRWLQLFLFVMFISPIMVNVTATLELYSAAKFFAYTGFIWMIVVFLFFVIGVDIDILKRIFFKVNFDPQITIPTALAVIVIAIIYGVFETTNIKTEFVELRTDKLPPHIENLRIVQISDVHFSTTTGTSFAEKITEKLKQLKPDILISTGDFLDRGIEQRHEITSLFQKVKAP